MVYQDRLETY